MRISWKHRSRVPKPKPAEIEMPSKHPRTWTIYWMQSDLSSAVIQSTCEIILNTSKRRHRLIPARNAMATAFKWQIYWNELIRNTHPQFKHCVHQHTIRPRHRIDRGACKYSAETLHWKWKENIDFVQKASMQLTDCFGSTSAMHHSRNTMCVGQVWLRR